MAGVWIERWHCDVRRHHSIDSGFDRLAEWRQVDRAQMLQILVHSGDGKVRICCGIAVAREVLGGSQHSVSSRTAYVGSDQVPYLLGILAERTCANDRVGRVGIHVGDRKKVP